MKTIKNISFTGILIFFFSCGNGNSEYDASGTFEATEVIVSAEANGKLMQFNVEEGSQLKANQEVGYIDTIQLYLKKMQLTASMKGTQNRKTDISKQIAATKEQIITTEREKKRTMNLLSANASTQKQLDDINSQLAVLEKQLIAQISTMQNNNASITEESSSLEIQIAQIEDQLKKCHISSPITGTVLAKYAETGELESQGKPLFKIANIEDMFLRAYITSDQLTQIKLGDQVTVYTDYAEKKQKEYEGTISWISNKAEFTPKTIQTKDERANLVYAIKIVVKNDGFIKIGMYGEIKLNEK